MRSAYSSPMSFRRIAMPCCNRSLSAIHNLLGAFQDTPIILTTRAARGAWGARSRPLAPRGIPRSAPGSPGRDERGELEGPVRGPSISISIMIGLVRALDRHADVVGLLLGERGQPHAQMREVQAGHLLVEHLGQHVHFLLVLAVVR